MSTINAPGQGDILMQDLKNKDPSKLIEGNPHSLEDDGKFCFKLKKGLFYRSKCVLTVAYIICSFTLGLAEGQIGKSFADLIHIANTTIRKGTLFFTMNTVGYLLGSMLIGYLFDKRLLDRNLLMFLIIAGYGVIVAIIPWCGMYEIMVAMFTVKGAFFGGLDTCGIAGLVTTWGNNGNSYLIASSFVFAIGYSVFSLVILPFAMSRGFNIPILNVTDAVNCTDNIYCNIEINGNRNNVNNGSLTGTPSDDRSSMIYIPYTITTGLCFMMSLPFIALCCISMPNKTVREIPKKKEENKKKHVRRLRILGLINIIIYIIIYIAVYGVMHSSYRTIIPSFIVVHMNWPITFSSLFTSGDRFFSLFGQFLGIFLVKCVSPAKMLLIFNAMLLIAFTWLSSNVTL